jgi:hypothetical protein
MLCSAVLIGTRYGMKEGIGAFLIVVGACVSVIPQLIAASSAEESTDIRLYAVIFYALSNAPMAMSSCYKEATFEKRTLDVWYSTQQVSIVQFFVSFLYMPLLALRGFGSQDGMPLLSIPGAFASGWRCFVHEVPECAESHAFFLVVGYCGVNILFTTLGLYLTKHGSAVLNSLSFSVLLPCTTTIFFMPLLGRFQEPFTQYSMLTFLGLLMALAGFWVYQRFAVGLSAAADLPPSSTAPLMLCSEVLSSPKGQASFQERVIGIGHPFGDYKQQR